MRYKKSLWINKKLLEQLRAVAVEKHGETFVKNVSDAQLVESALAVYVAAGIFGKYPCESEKDAG